MSSLLLLPRVQGPTRRMSPLKGKEGSDLGNVRYWIIQLYVLEEHSRAALVKPS